MNTNYRNQVSLLLEVLPTVSEMSNFILKGGTAINFFIQDFPRLSVDIDLIYLPLEDRENTLIGIENSLFKIKNTLRKKFNSIKIKEHINSNTKTVTRLNIIKNDTIVKIEPNLILRGTVFEPIKLDLVNSVQDEFEVSIFDIPIADKAELYAGKICAALDRQHPRDLFDIKILLDTEQITKKIKQAFLIYLCSHNRPIHELLNPHLIDQSNTFVNELQGMTKIDITYKDLEEKRIKLIKEVNDKLTDKDKDFLLSFKKGKPEWEKLEIGDFSHLPGIKWKQINISRMDKKKNNAQLKMLYNLLQR